jgi:3-hydroxyisobutyrate dehydrogenase-like beta-hydroxyacid dehydrogenase
MAKVGFIGLGVMGRPMAGHLIDAGHELSLRGPRGARLPREAIQISKRSR